VLRASVGQICGAVRATLGAGVRCIAVMPVTPVAVVLLWSHRPVTAYLSLLVPFSTHTLHIRLHLLCISGHILRPLNHRICL
jgi:hypothetical protein